VIVWRTATAYAPATSQANLKGRGCATLSATSGAATAAYLWNATGENVHAAERG